MNQHTHHHSLLAGVGASTAAVLVGGAALLGAWHRVAGPIGDALIVVACAVIAVAVAAAVAAVTYVFLWIRHRARNPELLAGRRTVVHAGELPAQPAWTARQVPADQPAAIEPGREVHLRLAVTPDQLAAIMRHHTEEDN